MKKFLNLFKKKTIKLSNSEVKWIKLCKGHFDKKYEFKTKNWLDILKPMFVEIYEYEPDENYTSFLYCMFNTLLDIYLKIQNDESGSNQHLKSIIVSGFGKTIRRKCDLPIERCISEICEFIQCNQVIINNKKRYHI